MIQVSAGELMTAKTRHFVELADIRALQMECSNCSSSLLVPISKFDRDVPTNCPNCGKRWGVKVDVGRPTGSHITEFCSAVLDLQKAMADDTGFTLTLEIPPPDPLP
jgi:DNA-directed RNA polymerase subunit RPC12/RpoP